jgi:hypothetical protein
VQSVSRSPQVLPIAWTNVLEDVEATLRKTEAATAEREQALGQIVPAASADEQRREKELLDRLPVQMQGWPAVLQGAEQETSAADAVLNAAEEALHQWLSKAETLTQGLAQWVERGV